jgi:hypothetical protein
MSMAVEAGSGGNVTYYTGSITMTANKQVYDLTDTSSNSIRVWNTWCTCN